MAPDTSSYTWLLQRFREVALVGSSAAALSWDQETYMPPAAAAWRGDQLAHLGGLAHRLATEPAVGEHLKAAEDVGYAPGSAQAVNLREWRRAYEREARLPVSHVEAFERTRAAATVAWRDARARSDFRAFLPHLAAVLALVRERAALWSGGQASYDVLFDAYEPGATVRETAPLLRDVAQAASALLQRARPGADRDAIRGDYPVAGQQRLNEAVARAVGFNFDAGRIDTTTHPFCTSLGTGDVRLTTRYNTADPFVSLFGVLHEAGHGLYEQGLLPEAFGQPVGSAASLGIHESQSRTWENKLGRSRPFWEHWLPKAQAELPDLRRFGVDDIVAAVNAVKPTFIRVEADEVSYDLHIALRFELEVALVEGTLEPAGVPEAWNRRFLELTGLEVPDDARGCLQDVHWSHGLIGYFATYTLGNLASAQLFAALRRDVPDLDARTRAGDFAPTLAWMRSKIHRHGMWYTPGELIRMATGEPLSARAHAAYLEGKFGG